MTLAINNRRLKSLFVVILLLYLVEYLILWLNNFSMNGIPSWINIVVFLITAILYFLSERRGNLLCFELMFLPVYFVGMFFNEIIMSNLDGVLLEGVGGSLSSAVTQPEYLLKSQTIQMIGYISFMLGCICANSRFQPSLSGRTYREEHSTVNYNAIVFILSLILLGVIVLMYLQGLFNSWFAYSEGLSEEERNLGLGLISPLCTMATVAEFSYLGKSGVSSLKVFLKKVNKLYFVEIMGITFLLMISGNRNEMLLIFLPFVVAFSVFIKKIKDSIVFIGLFVGAVLMIVIGLTRTGTVFNPSIVDLYDMSKDYSLVEQDCTYMIKYTDEKGPLLFSEFPQIVLSGIPIVGPRVVKALGLGFEKQSTHITTKGMASPTSNTGLGTSLIGDLYYNAYMPFVVIYMILFGYFISQLHKRFTVEKRYNMPLLLIYLYITSNAVYYVREQWDFPIPDMLYSIIMLTIVSALFKKKGRILSVERDNHSSEKMLGQSEKTINEIEII